MRATKIKMRAGSYYSDSLLEIDQIYIIGAQQEGYYPKASVHDAVKSDPGSIQVDIWPYPNLIAAISPLGEKYVRSSPNNSTTDNLLKLPRE